ncbi:acetylcholine receptor subunit alpha-like [Haliotis rubra]|uniref:acetylcholine receptor subunit alpha-like n=1 Tax=Haliotis rubra TaxID=36100 RepID=UPI001EE56A5A|nr:acetylcholine receptor subunit alpha-like [Haliotis rubra]
MCLPILLLFAWKLGVYAASYGEAVRLQQDLFQNYSVTVRPLLNQSQTISVALDLQIFVVHGLTWQDEILTWNPDDYGGLSVIKVHSSNIWLPDLVATNISEMVLKHIPIQDDTALTQNGEYNVHIAEVEKHPIYEAMVFRLKLDRRPVYYILVLILPIFILSLLCIVSFLIPASSGEKMSVSMTTLLSFTVYLGVIDSAIPKVSTSVSVLAVYVTAMLFLSFVAVLGNVCIVLLYFEKGDNATPQGDNPNNNNDKERANTGSRDERFVYGVSGESREIRKEKQTQPIHRRVNICLFWVEVALLSGTLGAVLLGFLDQI